VLCSVEGKHRQVPGSTKRSMSRKRDSETKNQKARGMGDYWEDRRKGGKHSVVCTKRRRGETKRGRKTTEVDNGTPFNSLLNSPLAPSRLDRRHQSVAPGQDDREVMPNLEKWWSTHISVFKADKTFVTMLLPPLNLSRLTLLALSLSAFRSPTPPPSGWSEFPPQLCCAHLRRCGESSDRSHQQHVSYREARRSIRS
jgi:hypothetical protein